MGDYDSFGKNNRGKDFNYYKKFEVTATTFEDSPTTLIPFSTQGVMFLNEETLSTQVVEFSFNGNTAHGELDPTLPSKGLVFDNRKIAFIWLRLKSGSSGPVTISIQAWAN